MPDLSGSWSRLSRIAALAFLLASVLGARALGQTRDSRLPFQSTAKPAPEAHLYWHFLMYQNYLDRQAAMLEQKGENGAELRNHFQEKLHFTDAQFGVVREAALRLQAQLDDFNAQIKPILAQDREWIKLHGRSSGPPPGHAVVQQLQKQHESLIANAVSELNQALGPESSSQLKTYIDTEWASHVTVHQFRPRPHDPKDHPPVPLHMEARQ